MAEQNENAHSFFDNCHLLNMTTSATSQQPTRRLSVTPRPQERFSLLTLYNWWISVVTLWLGYHALSPFLVVVAHEGRQPNGYLLIKSCKPLGIFVQKHKQEWNHPVQDINFYSSWNLQKAQVMLKITKQQKPAYTCNLDSTISGGYCSWR